MKINVINEDFDVNTGWHVSGLIQGALDCEDPQETFGLIIEEKLDDDPWINILCTSYALSDVEFDLLKSLYVLDPDGNGFPFYFVAYKNYDTFIYFQGAGLLNVEDAMEYGRKHGVPEEQLDFSENSFENFLNKKRITDPTKNLYRDYSDITLMPNGASAKAYDMENRLSFGGFQRYKKGELI